MRAGNRWLTAPLAKRFRAVANRHPAWFAACPSIDDSDSVAYAISQMETWDTGMLRELMPPGYFNALMGVKMTTDVSHDGSG